VVSGSGPPAGAHRWVWWRRTTATTAVNRDAEFRRGAIIHFRSGVHYDYVAVSLGDNRWRTTARVERTDDSAPINQFSWNPVNKIESWTDLIARTNTFNVATEWAPAPAVLDAKLAVVRFILKGSQEWDAAIHVGSGSWYSTVLETCGGEGGLHYLDYPLIRSFGDIVNNSTRIDLASGWQPLRGVGLSTYR
jgi:hypothetical protein